MKCLAVDTASDKLVAVLSLDGRFYSEIKETGKSGHSKALMPTVDALLKRAGCGVSEIDTVAVNVGPGSFTGIRIGVAAMTAIAFANGAERIAVTSFELLAYNRAKLTAAVDAGHGNLYLAYCENAQIKQTVFATAEQSHKLNREELVFQPAAPADMTLFELVNEKAAKRCYVAAFEPFYMRKSQAERVKDEI